MRLHSNSNVIKYHNSNDIINSIYIELVKQFRIELFKGKIVYHFKNGQGENLKVLNGKRLNNCIKETINYRMYDKIYFGAKDKLNIKSIKILYTFKQFFSRLIRNSYLLYYKFSQNF